jgi:serine/threonine protein phosphatase 1
VFLGDYIDRGPRSGAVVETVLELADACRVIPLSGNHEDMLLGFLCDPTSVMGASFIYNGGGATLASYANAHAQYEIPARHMEFFKRLQLFHETDDYFFVHAGVPEIPLDEISDEHRHELLWLREPFLTSDFLWSKRIVHGHTPVEGVTVRPNRIGLDTGCVANNALSAIELPSMRIYSVRRSHPSEQVFLKDASSRRAAVRFAGKAPVFLQTLNGILGLETKDFNELGFYARENAGSPRITLCPGDPVKGYVQLADGSAVRFVGEVVRHDINEHGRFVAVRFDRPTFAEGR